MKKQAIYYGLALGAIIALLKGVEYRYAIRDHALEVYGGALAVIFTSLGIWLALKLSKPKVHTVVVEREVLVPQSNFVFNEQAFQQTGISKRELEVLELMAKGLSNQEIAETLFVSLNTIKTHTSKVFEKLEVSRRTQAVQKAKEMGLLE